MKRIQIAETTLARAEGGSDKQTTFREKLEIVKILDAMPVDVIETPAVVNPAADAVLIKTIAQVVKNAAVSMPVFSAPEEVKRAWEWIAGAKKPRLNVKVPVSTLQMEYMLRRKPADVLRFIEEMVACAAQMCGDVEFTAMDATRAEDAFLSQAVAAAVRAGAKTVTLCDSAGNMLPDEFGAFIKNLYGNVPEMHDVLLGVECSNALSMACACAFQAVRAGASLIKTALGGESGVDLPAMVNIIVSRGDACGVCCEVGGTRLNHSARRVLALVSGESAPAAGRADAAQTGEEIALRADADIHEMTRAVRLLGYDLSEEDAARVYEAFSALKARKTVQSRELEAIVANVALQVPPTYKLISFVVNSGNIISATAHIVLEKAGERISGLSVGDGPIDASLMAIEKIIGHHYELDDFQLQSVTAGREALGEALVKLRDGGRLYSGRGLSTDIVGASIRAYLNALNKIVYRETTL